MDVGLGLVLILGALVVSLYLWRRRRQDTEAPTPLGEGLVAALGPRAASTYRDYAELRRRLMADPDAVMDQEFHSTADAVVAGLGPGFDARVSAWSRLDSLEPNLRALATRAVDPSSEEPMDMEAFADGVLLVRLVRPRLITPEDWWTFAASLCLLYAVEWRTHRPGGGRDAGSRTPREALPEASAVTDRLFAFGDETWWDVERDTAIDPYRVRRVGAGPYRSRADAELQLVVFSDLMSQLSFHSERCPIDADEDPYVVSIEQMNEVAMPDGLLRGMASAVPGHWFERWTLDCGGTRLPFSVAFMPDDDGGTRLAVTLIE